MRVVICFDARPHQNPLPRGEDFSNHASDDSIDRPANDAQFFHRSRQVADDEAASDAPERFAFRQAANVALAFGHDAAGMGEISMPIPARGFSRGRRMILRLRCVNPVAADVSPLIIPAGEKFEPTHVGCYDEIDERPACQSGSLYGRCKRRAGVWP